MVGMVGLSSGLTPEWTLANGYALGFPAMKNSLKPFGDLLDTGYVGCYTSVNEATKCKVAVWD